MFNNLIESSSHKTEFKRRGSFFLFTTATYAVLFIAAGVASIYAYDARLEDQNTQYITMLSPVELESIRPQPTVNRVEPAHGRTTTQNFAERRIAMTSTSDPRLTPDKPSAAPNRDLPLPTHGAYAITGRDFDPGTGGIRGPGLTASVARNVGATAIDVGTPPPALVEKPKPAMVHKKVINSEALLLPKPPYPPIARTAGVQGVVSVQVVIDESGRVISAKAVSGNPLLVPAAQQAAMRAKFSPTMLGESAVKVSGVITYNFTLQR